VERIKQRIGQRESTEERDDGLEPDLVQGDNDSSIPDLVQQDDDSSISTVEELEEQMGDGASDADDGGN